VHVEPARIEKVIPETLVNPNEIGVVKDAQNFSLGFDLGVGLDPSGVLLTPLVGASAAVSASAGASHSTFRIRVQVSMALRAGGVDGSFGYFNMNSSPPDLELSGDSHCIVLLKSRPEDKVSVDCLLVALPKRNLLQVGPFRPDPTEIRLPKFYLPL
jgi:hypothetical protein